MTEIHIYFSDYFNTDPEVIARHGAFDISLINDLPLFVDPFLLFNNPKIDYQDLHGEILRYMRFLRDMATDGQISPPLLESWFTFREVKQNWLGYSLEGNEGHGLGPKFARALHKNLHTVFRDFGDETITRSSHLEKLCLIRDGVGRDNISDFTINLIKGYLAQYTQEFARRHVALDLRRTVSVSRAAFNYETRTWLGMEYDLPWFNGDYVLLTPKDMLSKDETWINRGELLERFLELADAVPNAQLRAQVNEYLLRVIPQGPKVTKLEVKDAIAQAVDRFPEVIDYYILDKEDKGPQARSISRKRVSEVERRFVDQVRRLTSDYLEPAGFYEIDGNTYDEARARVEFLKDAIENKGAHRIFYHRGRAIERESDLQILYRLTWFATPSDVSREVNDGRGPADFKVSRGASDKTIVEFKLANNRQLERNLAKQAEIYSKASDSTQPPLKVILYFSAEQLERTAAILGRLKLGESPNVVLIDARSDNKPSGSKA